MLQSPYRKEWSVGTSIAKGFIGMKVGSRIPTISEYVSSFSCSRGIVQNALAYLEEREVITLDKQGKKGTYLLDKKENELFYYSGLTHLTASMPPPANLHLAGLATGICQGMSKCEIPFTFAFVQGSKNRVEALLNGSYDFIVTTKYAAEINLIKHPELEIAFPFEGCEYSLPYKLYINHPNKTEIENGMTIAVDPSSSDQVEITNYICCNKDVKIKEMPLISASYAFYTGQVDCIVFRDGIENSHDNLLNFVLKNEKCINPENISRITIDTALNKDIQLPVALINKDNYGMKGILKNYLGGELAGFIQKKVISGQMAPQFY